MDEAALADLRRFLNEDLGRGDVTSEALVAADLLCTARVVARQSGLLAGCAEACALARMVGLQPEPSLHDGAPLTAGATVLVLRGHARAVLGVERTVLNLVAHLSGVATATRRVVESLAGSATRVAATRKTIPGLRTLQKRAVVIGGGDPHRIDLAAAVLIKDNHLVLVGDVGAAVRDARAAAGSAITIEIEVETERDALRAAEAGADILLLDNMAPPAVAATVSALAGAGLRERVQIEASGGIGAANAAAYARAGADVVSMSELTLAAAALDFSMEINPVDPVAPADPDAPVDPNEPPPTE